MTVVTADRPWAVLGDVPDLARPHLARRACLWALMSAIAERGEAMSIPALARIMLARHGIARHATDRAISLGRKEGLLRDEVEGANGRRRRIGLTDQGWLMAPLWRLYDVVAPGCAGR